MFNKKKKQKDLRLTVGISERFWTNDYSIEKICKKKVQFVLPGESCPILFDISYREYVYWFGKNPFELLIWYNPLTNITHHHLVYHIDIPNRMGYSIQRVLNDVGHIKLQ